MTETKREFIIMFIFAYILICVMVGVIISIEERSYGNNNGCQHESLAAYINIPYWLTCELYRARF